MREPTFTQHPPRGDRHHFVTEAEVRVVLDRLPRPLWEGLEAVHFNDMGMGGRRLGYVKEGSDEIALCALPRRVSLAPFLRRGQSPGRFGAVRGCQWPGLAVRRFLLYDVFLRELGRIQIVDEKAKTIGRRFAGEPRAQLFAQYWRRELWSRPLDHPDPVHGPPSPEELQSLRDGWRDANCDYKKGMLAEKAKRYEEAALLLARAVERYPGHALALERLGLLTYAGHGATPSIPAAIELLGNAIRLDPTLPNAHLFLGLALARENCEADARRCFEQAMRLDSTPPVAMSMYADSLADWGCFAEAETLFQKALKRNENCVLAIRDYGRCLLREHNPEADLNAGRAIQLFERAVALDPRDAESHYRLGDALLCLDDEVERALAHLQRALELNPVHAKAAGRLAEFKDGGAGPAVG